MKLSRTVVIWAALAICGAIVLGAMTWLTRSVLDSEKDRALAESRADMEERTRLALWRMDALGTAILLRENRYTAMDFVSYGNEYEKLPPEVLLHFDVRQVKPLTTPELMQSDGPGNSTADLVFPERRERLAKLRKLLDANPLPGGEWTLLNKAAGAAESAWQAQPKLAATDPDANSRRQARDLRKDYNYQAYSNATERVQRTNALSQSVDLGISQGAPLSGNDNVFETPVEVGQMRAVWVGAELFLLRRVVWQRKPMGGGTSQRKSVAVQGVWLDSQIVRQQLLKAINDLLPSAGLRPVDSDSAVQNPLDMVSFPLRLIRNELPLPLARSWNKPLVAGWAAVALALLTTAALVHGVMRLSERRASFVSAVTHELRTPLTTFRLYSDMLASGAVKPEKRADYLQVLSHEADRLSHLVENVLSFSQVERGSARSVVREFTLAELLEPMRDRLAARLATAAMSLEMDDPGPWKVRVDSAAVEHILFNLIDNAAKYAAGAEPPVVEIRTAESGRWVEIEVADHGPGIPASERRRIFQAFHKSAREAAESQPGVGLGLALSRRLATALGGTLECREAASGANFTLSFPRV